MIDLGIWFLLQLLLICRVSSETCENPNTKILLRFFSVFSWKKWNVSSSNPVSLTCHGCRLLTAVKGHISERKAKPLFMEKHTPGTDLGLQSLAHVSLHTCSSTSQEKWAKYVMTNKVSMPAITFLIKIMDNFKHQNRYISPCPTMILTSAGNGFKSSRVQKPSIPPTGRLWAAMLPGRNIHHLYPFQCKGKADTQC